MSTATITDPSVETSGESNRLTETLEERLSHPATSPDFDLKKGVNEVLAVTWAAAKKIEGTHEQLRINVQRHHVSSVALIRRGRA